MNHTATNLPNTSRNHRARWAAFGAAVAVSLGAGGLGLVNAATPDGASAYIPIAPCRLVDTRAGDGQVGPQVGPLGPDTAITVDGWGDVAGDCNLPADSTGLQLNVTAVNASQATFLTLYPQGTPRPTASNVNVDTPSATPNAATVTLNSTNGQFHVFNRFGTVDVVIDVAGYFAGHQHDGADIIDESITGADVDNNSLSNLDTSNEAGVAWEHTDVAPTNLTGSDTVVASVDIRVPSDGFVNVDATLNWSNNSADFDVATCQITKGTTIDSSQPTFNLNDMDSELTLALVSASAHNTLEVARADNAPGIGLGQAINLVCDELVGDVHVYDVIMSAEFFPTSYNPGISITLEEGGEG